MKESFPITIWSGLITADHRERMGPGIWVFLWLVDKVTKEVEGRGYVLGGKSVTCKEIAEDLGISRASVTEMIRRLSISGYIKAERAGNGLRVTVLRSKKWKSRPRQMSGKHASGCQDSLHQIPEKHASDVEKTLHQMSEKHASHARMTCTVDSTKDSTVDMPSSSSFPQTEQVPDDIREAALREMASQPFWGQFVARGSDGTFTLSEQPSAKLIFLAAVKKVTGNPAGK